MNRGLLRERTFGENFPAFLSPVMDATTASCGSTTPLGLPVVPLVYMITAVSALVGGEAGTGALAPSASRLSMSVTCGGNGNGGVDRGVGEGGGNASWRAAMAGAAGLRLGRARGCKRAGTQRQAARCDLPLRSAARSHNSSFHCHGLLLLLMPLLVLLHLRALTSGLAAVTCAMSSCLTRPMVTMHLRKKVDSRGPGRGCSGGRQGRHLDRWRG